jgi:chromosomal replication initiation ATPase DnaA
MTCLPDPIASRVTSQSPLPSATSSRPGGAACIDKAVAMAFRVRIADLHGPARGAARIALARQVAMYLAHVELGLSFVQVGRAFGRTRTTAARACRRIEDLRPDSDLEGTLAKLERGLRCGCARGAAQ